MVVGSRKYLSIWDERRGEVTKFEEENNKQINKQNNKSLYYATN
jgi:hypothetical protein